MRTSLKSCMIGLLLLLPLLSTAQTYTTGIGIRVGGPFSNGLTIKHHLQENVALEGIVSSRWQGLFITALGEWHFPALAVDGLRWYVGGGAHIGFWDGNRGNRHWKDREDGFVLGVDLIGGLEYTFAEVPLNLSLDYKPSANFLGYQDFWGDEGSLSIRYVF